MSRTDKDRPYWVKVRDHGVEHHDHSHLGAEVWQNRYVKDENGNPIYEVVPRYCRADEVITARDPETYWYPSMIERDEEGRRIFYYFLVSNVETFPRHKIRVEADQAIAQGDLKRLIQIGTYRRRKMDRYLAYTIPEHCTIDEPHDTFGSSGYRTVNPCYMEADWSGEFRNQFRCSCCMCSGRDPHFERARRRNKRDQLRQATKLANSGVEDWYEDWNDLRVTTPLRYNTEWC